MKKTTEDLTLIGKTFGKLKIVGREKYGKKLRVVVQCFCGHQYSAQLGNIKINKWGCRSCMLRDKPTPINITHNKTSIPEYEVWRGMRQRCTNSKTRSFKSYGGRGIKVDPSWNCFDQFYRDMGNRPSSKYSLERIDNNKNYSKQNCRWATHKDQARNKRNTTFIKINDIIMTKTDWCDWIGINGCTVNTRQIRGMPLNLAIFTPINKKPNLKYLQHIESFEVFKK